MDPDLYDEFGNYVGPDLESEEDSSEEEREDRDEEERMDDEEDQVITHVIKWNGAWELRLIRDLIPFLLFFLKIKSLFSMYTFCGFK